ncbi:hypothetical protein K461DRAFT_30916 [Myriangium duriaei CBS 260.36]|uniref:Phytanoyl-CoA dioxygenase n=1 Tax=Myriangium duriaei CBS 260.36 TaxID=1168546 RepID=A0A9P4JFN0_9PEZI|nr:hypothetical protein K461DRAFT_30916 [Myriangium duriaei CBS 260.36]
MASAAPNLDLKAELAEHGFVLIPSLLSQDELKTLRSATAGSTAAARNGKWPHIRTLPKQFPPWGSDPSAGIWGVQHLLHPSQPSTEPGVYAKSYFHPGVLAAVTEILSCKSEDLVMELYNLLVRPDADFALRWHRDDIAASATAEEELEVLKKPITHAQWNLALYDDQSLIVVPGSHKRARTDEERAAEPYQDHIPGMKVVGMKAGDAVFYDNNILHRGVYLADRERATLHGSMGITAGEKDRARNVLQHGVGGWVDESDFSKLEGTWQGRPLREVAEGMRERLKAMGTGEGIGFFSKDE